MPNSNISLQQTLNFAATHADLLPLAGVGGYTNEPGLSICNDALSDILTSPNDFKWNQVDMSMLVTAMNKQDYLFAGAAAFTLGGSSTGAAIALASDSAIIQAGTTTTVKTLEPHRFKVGDTVYMAGNTVAGYNSTFTDDGSSSQWTGGWIITAITPTSFTFVHAQSGLGPSGAPGIQDFGWLASASMVEMNNTSSPQNTVPLQTVKTLQPCSSVANPEKVCVYRDNGDGTLQIRFRYVPGSTIWGVKLVYQGKAPLKAALTDTWAPIPDHYSALYRQAVLYRMYRYLNSPRAEVEYQKLQAEILKAQGTDDNEASDVHVVPEEGSFFDWGW